ncbi:MAG: DUF308 domain-containing protein [Clostridiaceae bacterium]
MPDLFDKKDSQKDKVTLGEDKFAKNPEYDKDIEESYVQNDKKEVVEVDQVKEIKRTGKETRKFGKTKNFLLFFAVVALLALASGIIQEMIFKSKESLVFMPKGGILVPWVGVVAMAVGGVLCVISFISLFNKRGKLPLNQKWLLIAVGIVFLVVGFSSFFRYVDFKENSIVDRSMLVTRAYTYMDVTEVNASTTVSGENMQLHYRFKLEDGKTYDVLVNENNMAKIKSIDTKIKGTARRSIDNYAIQEMERLKMYTKDEALKLFILE